MRMAKKFVYWCLPILRVLRFRQPAPRGDRDPLTKRGAPAQYASKVDPAWRDDLAAHFELFGEVLPDGRRVGDAEAFRRATAALLVQSLYWVRRAERCCGIHLAVESEAASTMLASDFAQTLAESGVIPVDYEAVFETALLEDLLSHSVIVFGSRTMANPLTSECSAGWKARLLDPNRCGAPPPELV